jgi:hypothetical protein
MASTLTDGTTATSSRTEAVKSSGKTAALRNTLALPYMNGEELEAEAFAASLNSKRLKINLSRFPG